MAVNASLKFTQNAATPGAGLAMKGVTGLTVTVNNVNTTSIASWQIDLVYTPPGSAVAVATPLAFNDNGNTPSATFTPDVTGSYRLVLKLWSVINRAGNPDDTDIRVFAVPEANGLVVPPAQDFPAPLPTPASGQPGNKANETNFSGQAFGWSGDASAGLMLSLIKRVDAITDGAGKLFATVALVLGTGTMPTTGTLRVPHVNGALIVGRDQGNTQDVNLLRWGANANNRLTLGSSVVTDLYYNVATGASHNIQVNTVVEYTFDAAALTMNGNNLVMGAGFISSGTTVAAAGLWRVVASPQGIIKARNFNNTTDCFLVYLTSDLSTFSDMTVGDNSANTIRTLNLGATTSIVFQSSASATEYTFDATQADWKQNSLINASFYSGTGTVATTGLLRAPANSTVISVRRSDNGANDIVLSVDATDNFTLGDANATTWSYAVGTGGTHTFKVAAATVATLSATTLALTATNLTFTTGFVQLGATTATAGTVRFANAATLVTRNAANTQNIQVLNLGSSDELSFGDSTQGGNVNYDVKSGQLHNFRVAGNVEMQLSGTQLILADNDIVRTNVSDASATAFVIRGTGSTASNNSGGKTRIDGGRRAGTGNYGATSIRLNQDDSTFFNMVEVTHLANARRAVSLCRTADLTTTELPTNAGDLVVYLGDAASLPSADAVGGIVFYSEGAKPGWRFQSSNVRWDATNATTASAGANGAPPANVQGYLTWTINGTARKIPFYAN